MFINCSTTEDEGIILCDGKHYSEAELVKPTNALFWIYAGIYVVLVLFAGVASGLTMGLLSLDMTSLRVLEKGGKPKERKYASRIITVVSNHHLLLVTLLLANATAAEAMPIFLGKITTEVVAILVSVTAVLLFGEIIPQALCTRYGLAIGYYASPLVVFLMGAFFIISYPIAKLLDCVLGHEHGTFYRRAELRELVDLHSKTVHDTENEDPLTYDEALIIKCALEMNDKLVKDVMTYLDSVYMISLDTVLDARKLHEIGQRGHSRIPVYEDRRDNITHILLVKSLITVNPHDNVCVRDVQGLRKNPPICFAEDPLYDILNRFQTGRSHLFLVYESLAALKLMGVITLEDVIEELIGEEIYDESDIESRRFSWQRQYSNATLALKARVGRQPSIDFRGRKGRPGSQLFQRMVSLPTMDTHDGDAEDVSIEEGGSRKPLFSVGDAHEQIAQIEEQPRRSSSDGSRKKHVSRSKPQKDIQQRPRFGMKGKNKSKSHSEEYASINEDMGQEEEY